MLLQKLLSLKMSDTQKMDDFFLETRTLVDQLGEIALVLPEELISIIVLNAMQKLYKGFGQSLISRDDLPPLGNIEAKLISEETRLRSDGPGRSDEALRAISHKQNIHLIDQERELDSLLTSGEEAPEELKVSHEILKANTEILTNIARASVTIVVRQDIGSANVHSSQ